MRILDKYILKAFWGPFFFAVCAFTSIFIGTGTLFRIAQYITEYGASLWTVTKVFFLAIPNIILLTFPMSVLLASLMAFGRLSGTSEIIVMRAGGQNFLRLAAPIYILALFISLGSTLFSEYVVPQTNHAYETIIREEIKKKAVPQTQEHIVLKAISNKEIQALMYARSFDASTKELSTITVQQFTNGELSRIENANKAIWDGDQWIMKDGVIYDLTTEGGVERMINFKEQAMPITTAPKEISANQKDPDEMSIKELRAQIKALQGSHVNAAKYEMEMYQRFSIPLASLVFALVGAPLGLQPQRSSSSIGFGVSVIIIFVYYGVMTFTAALGKGGAMPTWLAAFTPDLLGLVVGIYLNWRASK